MTSLVLLLMTGSFRDYQQAIETLLRLAEIYVGHGKDLHKQGQDNIKGVHEDDHLRAAEADLKV